MLENSGLKTQVIKFSFVGYGVSFALRQVESSLYKSPSPEVVFHIRGERDLLS